MSFLKVLGKELGSTKEEDGFDVEDEGAVRRTEGRVNVDETKERQARESILLTRCAREGCR